jgi:putative transposase
VPTAKPGGRPPRHDRRELVNAMLYVLRAGETWRLLPHDFPPWQPVYHHFWLWQLGGTWERIHTTLRKQARLRQGRTPQPSGAILDSQSVKTTGERGCRGYDGAKKLSGRKRHLLVDTGGLILRAVVQPANVADRDGARAVLAPLPELFPTLHHIWADMGYRGYLLPWAQTTLGVQLTIVTRPRRWVRVPAGEAPLPTPPLTVLPRRWVVERTFAWLGRYRRLSKDYEALAATEEAWIYLAMTRLMLARLAP